MQSHSGKSRAGLARKLAIDLSIMTVIGVLMAVIGPFGSFEQPLAMRLLVWLGLAYAGYAIYAPLGAVVDRLHQRLDLPRAGLWTAAVVVASVPMAMIVWSLNFFYGPLAMPTAETALLYYLNVLVVGGAVTVLFNILDRPIPADAVPPETTSEQPSPVEPIVPPAKAGRFFDRLPAALGTELIALEMEDHYVRAHTALGSELILLRMRDAVAELDGLDGAQVHRSWWVARGAVEDVKREGRNIRLVLANDIEAPVARSNVAPLKDAGWF